MMDTSTQAVDGLNPFPGYPVASIVGAPDRTVVTWEIGQSRDIVRDHVKRWRPIEIGAKAETIKPVEWSAVVLVSGDYGTGKTHLLVDCANFLRDEILRRTAQEVVVVRVAALAASPSGWYRDLLGKTLGSYGERTADGGLFTRLILQVYSIAAKSLLINDAIRTDSLNDQPAVAMRLVSEGLLNPTSVWNAFQAILRQCCARAPETVREHFIALMEAPSRARSERWLAGGGRDADADCPSDQEAAGILAATAALCGVARWPFALVIDEIEQFLKEDDRSGSEVNTTWLKRLLSDLAEAGAFVAVGGHVSAWERRRDFLDRFSGGSLRIDMRRLEGSDVLAQVAVRAGPDTYFGPADANVVAEVCKGNMRRILTLCRVLYDRYNKFTVPLTEKEIRDCAAERGRALTRDQALLNIREAFETRDYAVSQEMKDGGTRFDLVARNGGGMVIVVAVRETPEVKEAQDLAIQFVRQINVNRRPGERARAFFVCDTPEDRGVRQALLDWPDIDFAWFDYTNPDAASAIRRAIDQGDRVQPLAPSSGAVAPDFVGEREAALNKRLDELDRQRTSEVKDLYQRLADAERRASATDRVAPASGSGTSSPAGPADAPQAAEFSAAELLAKPGLGLRLRVMMSSANSWFELILLTLGLFVAATSSWVPELWLYAPHCCVGNFGDAMDDYRATFRVHSLLLLVGGILVASLMVILLIRRYLAVDSYFDHADQLINEEYLIAPHPWLLAGANRVTRQLAFVYGPREAMLRLQKEIEDLVGRRNAMPARAAPSPPE